LLCIAETADPELLSCGNLARAAARDTKEKNMNSKAWIPIIALALFAALASQAQLPAQGKAQQDHHHKYHHHQLIDAGTFGPPPSTRTVSGNEIGHYKNGPVPVDLSTSTIAAFAPNGAGGYTFFPGSGTSSGTFTIANVPSGFYLLQLGGTYLWTSNTVVDADFNADYRSDTVQADQNTTVTFDLTHVNAWQNTDFLELVCPNNAAFDLFLGTAGETTFTGTFPYMGSLSVGSEGDQYYVFQLITQKVGGLPFTALGRYIAPAKFTQAQGSDTPLNGRLKSIRQNHSFEANINGADLAAQALAANPRAVLIDTGVYLDVYPGSLAKGENTSTPDVVAYNFGTGQPLITTNGDLGTVRYGNPFRSTWPLWDLYQWLAVTRYTAPGATQGTGIPTDAYGTNPKLPTSTSPIKPLVGAVHSPSINHKNFFTDRKGVSTTPTLRWSPPSVGKATYYDVRVWQLSNNGGNTIKTLIAGLRTQRTSLLIPKGVVSAGPGYVFDILAYYTPGVTFSKTPFMNGATLARAHVISGMMQP
jgi:hypothetical protein